MGLYPSGLYTEEEVQARLNYRLYEFSKLTGCLASTSNHLSSVAGQRDYVLDDKAIDILHVAFQNSNNTLITVPVADPQTADFLLGDVQTPVDVPYFYTLELGDVNTITLVPPPADDGRLIHLTYVRRPLPLSNVPINTELDLPTDFTPFIKYGALADLFNKAGEPYDPQRAQICEGLYQLGIQAVKGWVSSKPQNG